MVRLFVLTLSVCLSAPFIFAAPALKPERDGYQKLAGTIWTGETFEGWAMTLEFSPDGSMIVSYNGGSFRTASWKQEGNKLYYEMNTKYCEFHGKIAPDLIDGETHNVVGKVWVTKLKPLVKK